MRPFRSATPNHKDARVIRRVAELYGFRAPSIEDLRGALRADPRWRAALVDDVTLPRMLDSLIYEAARRPRWHGLFGAYREHVSVALAARLGDRERRSDGGNTILFTRLAASVVREYERARSP